MPLTPARPPAHCARRARRAARLGALLACAATAALGPAHADGWVDDLDRRLAAEGADSVNAWLLAHRAQGLAPLHRRTADCELPAVSLALRLGRSADVPAVRAHHEALRQATGRCAPFVLALLEPSEVARVCASVESWGPAQTARELRRRMATIDAHDALRTSATGKACHAAYLYELQNTRVVLKKKP